MACPSTEKQDQMFDFSHILDFCSQVKSLSIEGSYEKLGTSSIVPNELFFDLIPFKSLVDLRVLGVPMGCIQSVGKFTNNIIHFKDFLDQFKYFVDCTSYFLYSFYKQLCF